MSEQGGKQPPRFSFSKDKVGKYNVGATGITGTSANVTNPVGKATFEDGSYNSSDLLLENIDKLGMSLTYTQKEQNSSLFDADKNSAKISMESEDGMDDYIFEEETEEELANNLDKHFETKLSGLNLKNNKILKDNFCRSCGKKFLCDDRYCAKCGNYRVTEAVE